MCAFFSVNRFKLLNKNIFIIDHNDFWLLTEMLWTTRVTKSIFFSSIIRAAKRSTHQYTSGQIEWYHINIILFIQHFFLFWISSTALIYFDFVHVLYLLHVQCCTAQIYFIFYSVINIIENHYKIATLFEEHFSPFCPF